MVLFFFDLSSGRYQARINISFLRRVIFILGPRFGLYVGDVEEFDDDGNVHGL